jgi:hypothetical protein
MPSTDFKGGCFVARFEHLADWAQLSAISTERACFYHFRGYRERLAGGALCRRLAVDLPQGADLHMTRTDTACMPATSHTPHTAHLGHTVARHIESSV